jgi:hypothetical protein
VPLWMGLWLACGGDGRDRHPDPTDSTAPDPVVPPRILDAFVREPELAPLARELVVHTDVPTRVTVALSADGVDTAARFPGFSTRHEVPVMGARSGRTHDLTVVVEDEQGQQSGWATTFRTEAVVGPEFPALEVRSRSPEAECDLVLLPLQTPDGRHWLVVVDARDGEVVWWWSSPRDLGDVELTPRGTLLGLSDGILELDWLGKHRPLCAHAQRRRRPGRRRARAGRPQPRGLRARRRLDRRGLAERGRPGVPQELRRPDPPASATPRS